MKINLFIMTCILIASGCNPKNNESETPVEPNSNFVKLTDEQLKLAHIELGKIEMKPISTILRLNGKIDVPPQNLVSVSTPFGGFLKSTQLLPGMYVKKGDVIATMEDQQFIQLQQDYLMAKSKLNFAQSEYNRQKELNQSKAVSDKVYQQAEMEFQTQHILLNALAEKLRLININPDKLTEANLSRVINVNSSIDGFVSKVFVNIGKYVNPSDVLFELINPSDIHLNLTAFDKDLKKLYIGQKLIAYNNHEPNRKHPCEIILVSQDLSQQNGAEVHCHFLDYDKTLLPGMYMNAEIEIDAANLPVVPTEAIVTYEGKDYIFCAIQFNAFQLTGIEKGETKDGFTAVKLDAKININSVRVVKTGAYSLLMQLKNKAD
ncbi:MAG: efflux RND transporter periplasmic adaptor subunit [Bacteroidetes bacterium]|nr:efflux RND transporter periplasmic adaptor subunit [Bacteroidota bacterium]MCA6445135.1 efflux RND transporter periplasmic adaptor subunit [Bacteroidota bacterium]